METNTLFKEKNILVTGIVSKSSIAYGIAKALKDKGAKVILTGHGRAIGLTQRVALTLGIEKDQVLELDVQKDDHLKSLSSNIKSIGVEKIHGVVHSIAFANKNALGGNFLNTEIAEIEECMRISSYSYYLIVKSIFGILSDDSSLIAIDFDASKAVKGYDWMGVAKASLESISRYLALYLAPRGIRSNLIAAGPISTLAARGIPNFATLSKKWEDVSPLSWSTEKAIEAVSQAALFLLSKNSNATTGEIVHVDGGVNSSLI